MDDTILTLRDLAREWGVQPRTMKKYIVELGIPVLPGSIVRVYKPAYLEWCAENSDKLQKHRVQ